ncbi:sensor histidine kinase [Ancylobacter defluvii]|uniref:sensor histidine kinase n=1 Tax=Ancylobacter defluvii TaxID=1282440 RepID=UPI001BD1609F|nr:histidine kinase [Ancylobacter defluvii]MBS7585816.1 histidine kinase [Ancylobacter defluvii]
MRLWRLCAGLASRWSSWSPVWRGQVIGWGLFALVDLVDRQLIYRNIIAALVLTAISYPLLLLLSVALRRIYDRICPDTRLTLAKVGIVLGFSGGAAAIAVGILATVRIAVGWTIPDWLPLQELVMPFSHYTLAFIAWSILYFWIGAELDRQRERQHAVEAQMDALRAEIRQLQLQLDPHFLFNALNGVAEEVPEHPEAALAMIRDLTQHLRHLLAGIRSPVVTVASEVEGLSAYLRIQQSRFGARVRSSLKVDPMAAERSIVNLLLQPLVENAFEHGDRAARLDVDIRIGVLGEALKIEIENTGHLVENPKRRPDHGLGLQNVRRRLDVHYPDRHSFAIQQAENPDGRPDDAHVIATLLLEGEPCSVL